MTPAPGPAATFAFADLAGFTALTESHGDEHALALVEAFETAVSAQARKIGAEHVKSLGDAVMLRVPDAAVAIRLGVWMVHDAMDRHGAPAVRVGMHTGSAVERAGDYFGATVNVAARVSGVARDGEVLLTRATRRAAGALADIELVPRGRQTLRNVREPIELYAAAPFGAVRYADVRLDPVCRMELDPALAAGRLTHDGREYLFCSLACAAEFARRPEQYATPSG